MREKDTEDLGKTEDLLMDHREDEADAETGNAPTEAVDQERIRHLFGDKLVPEILRRGIESGMDTFLRSDRGVRKVISDLKLRRELTNYFFHQIDETKNAALRVVAGEVRDFLENTNLEQSLYTVLTSLAFEIRTEVRFVPTEDGPLRPRVKSRVDPSGTKKKKTAGRKRARKRTGKARAGKSKSARKKS